MYKRQGEAAHPRAYGTFPRVLGRYVREQQVLTWEDAVRKMTGLPAATVGLVDRGLLAAGMAADVVMFDPVSVIDHATFEAPTLQSEGIRAVVVNGQLALRDGRPTGLRAGQALRRTSHMPTRPMNGRETRAVARRATPADATVMLDVTQRPGARRASGTFRVTDRARGVALAMTEFGQLQSATNWATFTGRARLRPAEPERSVLVILDGDELIVKAGEVSLTVAVRR